MHLFNALIEDYQGGIAMLFELCKAFFGFFLFLTSFKAKGLGDNTDGEDALLFGYVSRIYHCSALMSTTTGSASISGLNNQACDVA